MKARSLAKKLCPKCGRHSPAPGRTLCEACLGKARAAEHARYLKRKSEGAAYGGRDPESRRRMARERARKRRRERLEAGLCTACGERKPAGGNAVCEMCREERRAAERKLYAERRAGGRCGRCGAEVIGKASTCASCAALMPRAGKAPACERKRQAERNGRQQLQDGERRIHTLRGARTQDLDGNHPPGSHSSAAIRNTSLAMRFFHLPSAMPHSTQIRRPAQVPAR